MSQHGIGARRRILRNTQSAGASFDGAHGKRLSAVVGHRRRQMPGLAGCGALAMQPDAIRKWAAEVRAGSNGGFQVNLWIPDPPPRRDPAAEEALRQFLGQWGPAVARAPRF